MKLLSIGIPTYNRPDELNDVLNKLAQSGIFERVDVQVMIQDNSDIAIAKKNELIASRFSSCVYERNLENLGFHGNLLAILAKANSRYLWYLSDDDNIFTENIDPLVNYLQAQESNVITMCPFANLGEEGAIVNTSKHWQNASKLEDLYKINLPFILFSSYILPIGILEDSESRQACLSLIDKHTNNDYIQILIPLAIQSSSSNQLKISYYNKPVIAYKPAKDGRFSLYTMYDSLVKVYDALLTHDILTLEQVTHKKRDLVRSHLLMLNQHKAGLKVIYQADKYSLFFAKLGLQYFDIKNFLLIITYFLLPKKLSYKILSKRGHAHFK